MTRTDIMSDKTKEIFNDYKKTLKSEKSQMNYYYIINGFCLSSGVDYLNAGLTDFKSYFEQLDTAAMLGNMSTKTVCLKYNAMLSFSTYIVAHAKDYNLGTFTNYMARVQKPIVSINVKPENIPTLEQLDRIYTAAQHDILMYCVIALINKCGLTVEQVCGLKLKNFILDSEYNCGMLFPYQYTADKYIKIPDDVRDILEDYVVNLRESNTDYLFCNKRGNQLSERVLQKRMQKIINEAAKGDPWSFTLQDLRNMAAVLMLKGGAEKDEVANYIGTKAKWMQRYQRAVEEFVFAPCDCININIKRFNQK